MDKDGRRHFLLRRPYAKEKNSEGPQCSKFLRIWGTLCAQPVMNFDTELLDFCFLICASSIDTCTELKVLFSIQN